ncbi:MAG: cell division protein ZipA [Gammaproteobacteria bacterium]|jgi:cell division protein ZipA|nr:cell division protein ZipA [Gammaproteobacteria bacterium]
MSGRELIILLLGLAVVAVVLRGLFVALQSRRGQIKLAIDKNIPQNIDLEALEMSELPSGGARVVARSLEEVNRQNSAAETANARAEAIDLGVTRLSTRRATASALSASASAASGLAASGIGVGSRGSAHVPVLMDAVELSEAVTAPVQDNYEDPDEVLLDYQDGAEAQQEEPLIGEDSNSTAEFEEENKMNQPVEEEMAGGSLREAGGDFAPETDFTNEGDLAEQTDFAKIKRPAIDTMSQVMPDYPDEDPFDEEDEDDAAEAPPYIGDSVTSYESLELSELDDPIESEDDHEVPVNPPEIGSYTDEDNYAEQDGYQDVENQYTDEEPAEQANEDTEAPAGDIDTMAGFSMTAGERIGVADTPVSQNETPQEAYADDKTASEVAAKPARKSIFSWFGRKLRIAEESPAEELTADEDIDAPLTEELPIEEVVEDDPLTAEVPPVVPIISMPDEESASTEAAGTETASTATASEQVDTPPETTNQIETTEPSEVIVLNVMAQDDHEFHGTDLMQVLITAGLKFGEMSIFHQRANGDNKGPVVFSVANILNPGTFDLNNMDDFYTRGVSLFLALPAPVNNLQAFDQMLDVAQQICGSLDGELKDDHRSNMTAQTIEHYRQRISDFELRRLKATNSRKA